MSTFEILLCAFALLLFVMVITQPKDDGGDE